MPKHLCEEARICNGGGDHGRAHLTESSEVSLSRLNAFFSDLGICFKLGVPVQSTAASQADWARTG